MTKDQIMEMQRRICVQADGVWGPVSRAACQSHLRKLMPSPNPWPSSDDVAMTRFFGRAGDEENLARVVMAGLKYEGKPVGSIRCHRLIAEPLLRVLREIHESPHAWLLGTYAGCYNYRQMRNGSRMSKHAWGVAIDFDAERNGLRTPWPQVATMPLEVMEMFAREGFQNLGWVVGSDAMHFEACR
jgi:hypothetical protein